MKKLTTDEFIKRAKTVHGDKYDYSKVNYINADTKVCIICPEHGEFWQTPYYHVNKKQSCPKCAIEKNNKLKRCTAEVFIQKAKMVHGNKYDYSKVKYGKNNLEKVCIICPEHGEFWQSPGNHLRGEGCPECRKSLMSKKISSSTEEFIKKAKKVHGDEYNYSKVEYKNNHDKVCIICPKHGEFWQRPDGHLQGRGCHKCKNEKLSKLHTKSKEIFIKQAKIAHENKYDYSKVKYVNNSTKICIICPEHGEFWQMPKEHLKGQGCPKCAFKESTLENEAAKALKNRHILFLPQKSFEWLKNDKFLKLDFYVPSKKIAIECQGIQHFEPVEHFGSESEYQKRKKRDARKKTLCEENGIKLYYFSHVKYNEFLGEKVYHDINELINAIKN